MAFPSLLESMVTLPFSLGVSLVSLDKKTVNPTTKLKHQPNTGVEENVGSFQSTSVKNTASSSPNEQTLRANDSLMNLPSGPSCNLHFYWVSQLAELGS